MFRRTPGINVNRLLIYVMARRKARELRVYLWLLSTTGGQRCCVHTSRRGPWRERWGRSYDETGATISVLNPAAHRSTNESPTVATIRLSVCVSQIIVFSVQSKVEKVKVSLLHETVIPGVDGLGNGGA